MIPTNSMNMIYFEVSLAWHDLMVTLLMSTCNLIPSNPAYDPNALPFAWEVGPSWRDASA